jgi:putative MATE family efflux protein
MPGVIALSEDLFKVQKKQLITYAIPLLLENGFGMLIGFVATIFIARYDNGAAGAVGVANMLLGFFHLLFMIVSVGAGILSAQYIGAKLMKEVSTVTVISILANLILGILGSLAIWIWAEDLLKFLNLSGELLAFGTTYIRIVALSTTFQAMWFSLSAIIRSYGYTKLSLKIAIVPNLVNIVLNYVFIYGVRVLGIPSLGVAGVGIAAAASQFAGFLISFIILAAKIDPSLSLRLLSPFPKRIFIDIMKIGVPSTGENISYHVSQMLITSYITALGAMALNTKTYYVNIAMFIYWITVAMSQAAAIMVGNLAGAGKSDQSYRIAIYSFKVSLVATIFVNALFIVLIVPLMRLFTDNPDIIALAKWIVLIDFVLEIGRAIGVIFGNSLKASGDVRFPVVLNVVVTWLTIVPLAYFLGIGLHLGLSGIWIAFAFDETLRGVILFFRWRSRKWETKAFVNRDLIKS